MAISLFIYTNQLSSSTNLFTHVTNSRFQTIDTKLTNYQSFLLQTPDTKITNYESFLLQTPDSNITN